MFLKITIYIILIVIGAVLIKLVRGPSLWDRLMALNIISIKIIMLVTVYAVMQKNTMLLDLSIAYSIIGFLAVSLISQLVLKGGRLK